MGRQPKKGLDYFNVDCNQEDNLNFIEAKHGIVGYGVVVKLWKKIYQIHGYYAEWSQKSIYLFAKEVGLEVELVRQIIETCFEEQIFSKDMFDKFEILTSRGIQKRWKKIVIEAKRKNVEIESDLDLLPNTQMETLLTPEEILKTPGEKPQIKEKENKEKKTTFAALPMDKVCEKAEESPPWDMLVKVWFDFVTEKFKQPPLFAGEDPRFFKSIIRKLEARANQNNNSWNKITGPTILKFFLGAAYKDPWIARHFLLRTLDGKFEEIERIPEDTGVRKSGRTIEAEINYLYGRFLEREAKWENYEPSYFSWLQEQKVITLSKHQLQQLTAESIQIRISQLAGSNHAQDLRALDQYQKCPGRMVEEDKVNLERVLNKRGLLAFFTELTKFKVEDLCEWLKSRSFQT